MENHLFENRVLLRATEVAQVLEISRAKAYRLIQQGIIPSVRIDHSVRVRPCDLEAYIQKNWSEWTKTPESEPG